MIQFACPHCQEPHQIHLQQDSVQVLRKGIECLDCFKPIGFKLLGNKVMIEKPVPVKRLIINKPKYQFGVR